mgnify:CR=1 FL=1
MNMVDCMYFLNDYVKLLHSGDNLYTEKLERIIQEKPKLPSEMIYMILSDIICQIYLEEEIDTLTFYRGRIKPVFAQLTKEEIITKYFDRIFGLYENKLSVNDLVCLCMNLQDEKIGEIIIRRHYKKIRKEIRKTLYVPAESIDELSSIWEINEYEVKPQYQSKHYEAKIGDICPNVLRVFYQYFDMDIKFFLNHKIEKYNEKVFKRLNKNVLFSLLQKELLKEDKEVLIPILRILKTQEFANVKLTNELPKYLWIRILRNREILEEILVRENCLIGVLDEEEKTFQDAFVEFIYELNIKKIEIKDITKIDSIYCLEYFSAIDKLASESYLDNKNNYLFLICFKLFLKEFVKEYCDELTISDIEYLERIFRRSIQRKNIYPLFKIKNKKNLIHHYKSNDILLKPDEVNIEHIYQYNVKQYRKIKELMNNIIVDRYKECYLYNKTKGILMPKKSFESIPWKTKNKYDECIIISLNILGYEATKKLIESNINTWENIINNIKEKTPDFHHAFRDFVLRENSKDQVLNEYSLLDYLLVFEKLLISEKKITLNRMNKVIRSIKNLLVPYNIHIEPNLEKLNDVAKGDPFLEKINGIKLYETYRRRIKSSIPDCCGEYHGLEYKLVDLHAPEIISNGIGKYLLPNAQKASSCLTPNGKAKTCLEHGAVNPNGRFFKITRNANIVAYSWVWRRGEVLCFDNIELTEEVEKIKDYEKVVYEIYLQAAKTLTEMTRSETKRGIKLVLIGRNEKDIKNSNIDHLPYLEKNTTHLFKPTSETEIYLKDSSEKQIILYGAYSKNLDTTDVEAIYLSKRLKVESFFDLEKEKLEERMNAIYYDYCLQHSMKYHKIKNTYESGYIGEDWFVGMKKDSGFDFFYNKNDKRLFEEVKKILKSKQEIQESSPKVYFPKFKIENILNSKNIHVDTTRVENYLKQLSTYDHKIPSIYYSHTTGNLENLSSIFRDGAITSSNYGQHAGGIGSNGMHYICIAKVGSEIYHSYKRTGTIILDDNMQIFSENDLILPSNVIANFTPTSYPIRKTGTLGEYQVKDIITKDHFNCLLAIENNTLTLAQIILLNEAYELNLPIVLESTMSEIDTTYVKKHIKLSR